MRVKVFVSQATAAVPVYQTEMRKKYVQNSGFWSWIFSQILFVYSGILKIPLDTTPFSRGFSKPPPMLRGSG